MNTNTSTATPVGASAPRRSMSRGGRTALVAGLAVGIAFSVAPVAQATADASTNASAGTAPSWRVVAHRGGDVWGPESTLATFNHMLKVQSDAVEFDVNFTKDGVPVVLHDDTLNRTTNCTGLVWKKTWKKVQKCDAGTWFDGKFAGQRVPSYSKTVRYLAKRSSTLQIFVHVKDADKQKAKKLLKVVRENKLPQSRVVFIGKPHHLKYLAKAGARNLGYVFNSDAGWASKYNVLIPFNVAITAAKIEAAHRAGKIVLPVESRPYKLSYLKTLPVDGVLVNDLDGALRLAGRLAPIPLPPVIAPPADNPPADNSPGDNPSGDNPSTEDPSAEHPPVVDQTAGDGSPPGMLDEGSGAEGPTGNEPNDI